MSSRAKIYRQCGGIIPPLPGIGERIEVRGQQPNTVAQSLKSAEQSLTSVLSLYKRERRSGANMLHLMRACGCASLRVVVVHDETRMDDARYPAEQRQNDA